MPIDSRSRVEDILNVILGNLDPSALQPPQSRVEALLQRLNEMISDFDGKIPIHICTSTEYDHETLMPTIEDPNEDEFYLVPAEDSGEDMYIEWIFTEGNRWERFGSGGGTIEIKQSDWNQNDSLEVDYIKNKPDLTLKLDKNQGVANSGKFMGVNSSGNVVPLEVEGGNIAVTEELVSGEDYELGIEEGETGSVISVAGKTGTVTLDGNDVVFNDAASYNDGTIGGTVADLKSQTNANTFDINILKSYHKSDLTYADISKIVKAGAAADWFEIGDQIVTTWSPDGTTNYDMPWDVVDIAPVVNADGDTVPGLWLESHWALPDLQFDASEAIYVATETMPSGTYYFTFGSDWGQYCKSGESYSFTTTVEIPAGGQIVIGQNDNFYTWNATSQPPTNWRAHTFSSATSITPLDTNLILTKGATGVSLGTIAIDIQTGASNPNNLQRAACGYNRYSQSAMRQWLNSDAAAGAWWTAQNVFDRPAQQVATMRGFMAGLPADFLAVIKPVKVSTALNTLSDGGGVDDVYDRFFLASLEQEYIVPQFAGVEGSAWDYWKDRLGGDTPQEQYSTNANHIRYGIENHVTAYTVRLRSAFSSNANNVWHVNNSGKIGGGFSTNATSPAPACVIC